MKQNDWKIIYTNYGGITARAVNLLSKEVGKFLIREEMVYRIYVLPCEKEGADVPKNAFFIGLYDESETIRRFVSENEVSDEGFTVKVTRNPDDAEGSFVFLTAKTKKELLCCGQLSRRLYSRKSSVWGSKSYARSYFRQAFVRIYLFRVPRS